MGDAPFLELFSAQPVRAYEKSSIDQFVIAAEHERERLHAALDRATRRREAAEQRIADAASMKVRFAELIEQTQRLVADLRRDNERAVAAILDAAEAEVQALLPVRRAENLVFTRPSAEQERPATSGVGSVELTVRPAI